MGGQSHEAELLRCARNVARLQTQRRKLKRQLKKTDADLRLERKHLRALANMNLREPDILPSRLFGPGVGHKVRDVTPAASVAAIAKLPDEA